MAKKQSLPSSKAEYMKKFHTKELLLMRPWQPGTAGHFDGCEGYHDVHYQKALTSIGPTWKIIVTSEDLYAELNTREHVPSSRESRGIRLKEIRKNRPIEKKKMKYRR